MPERTTVPELVQVAVESSIGVLTPATKQLQSFSIDPHIMADFEQIAPMGNKFNTINVPGKEWTEADISGAMTYDELIYLFATFFATTAGVQIGTTGAYTWKFDI